MADTFSGVTTPIEGPADHAVAVTPSDGTDLAFVSRGIYVGGAGDLSLNLLGGETVTLTGVQAGVIYPMRAVRVRATGTTATNIVSVW